jgi:hypothetical protein
LVEWADFSVVGQLPAQLPLPHVGSQQHADQRISGSADQRWMVLPRRSSARPDANNARSQRPAPEGNWRVSCSCLLCWNTRGCPQIFQHVHRSSILCGCINKFLYRQANAVWGRSIPYCMAVLNSLGTQHALRAATTTHSKASRPVVYWFATSWALPSSSARGRPFRSQD